VSVPDPTDPSPGETAGQKPTGKFQTGSRSRPSETAPCTVGALALSGGEPAGIGPDIALAAWARRNEDRTPAFGLFADADVIAERRDSLKLDVPLQLVSSIREAARIFPHSLPIIDVRCSVPVVPGTPDPANGRAVINAIELATKAVATGDAAALVTNPIAKHVLYDAGFRHPGHTEFLAELAELHYPGARYRSVMMLAADELRVVPLTIHVALAAVPALVTAGDIEFTVRIIAQALRLDFGVARARIAVAGLNPHAGENGTMGTEDRDVIAPVIEKLRAEGIDVRGPLSADTLFHAAARETYDAVLAMYHDQALIPLKTLAFDRGVNITLGLPFVRTSPDHGTAFDIAGTGRASRTSLVEALACAARMAEHRAAAVASS
jgi:4-hydroxythreonine-4-phosphate dehydrogenase